MASSTEDRHVNIYINNQVIGNNMKDINAAYNKANAELNKMTRGTKEYIEKSKEVAKLKGIINEHKEGIGAISSAWDKVKSVMMGVIGGNLITNLISGITSSIRSHITGVIEMDDAYADVEKTTGMTRGQVEALGDQFADLNTRTSQMDLVQMAIIGGQIGVAKEEMFGFVEATDKAAVALGDEFKGGVQEVTNSVGGLKLLFKDTRGLQAGESIIKIGSAINDLGAAGKANGPFMTDFAQRVAGLGPELTPRIHETLGLGAALQELGETAENAASGTKTLITTGASNIADYAKHLGMGKKELKELINTNPNEFLLKLATSFKGMTPVETINKLEKLNINSKEAQGVMLKLAGNVDFVREKQELANASFEKGTSLQEEFNKKNETSGANFEKLGKTISNWVSDKLKGLVQALSQAAKWFNENRAAIGTLISWVGKAIVVYATYKAVQYASNEQNKFSIKGIYDWIKAQGQAMISGQKFSGMLTKLKSIDPFSLMAAAAVGLYMALKDVFTQSTLVTQNQEKMLEIENKHKENLVSEVAEVDLLFERLKSMNTANEDRQKLIDEINSKYGTTLTNLKDEKEFLAQVNNEYNKLIKSMTAKVDLQIMEEQFAETRRAIAAAKKGKEEITGVIGEDVWKAKFDQDIKELEKGSKKLAKEIIKKKAELDKDVKAGAVIGETGGGTGGAGDTGGDDGDEKKKKEKEFDYQLEKTKQINEALLKLKNEYRFNDSQLEIFAIAEKYKKELDLADEAIGKLQDKAKEGDAKAIAQIDELQRLKADLILNRDAEMHEKEQEQMKKSQEEGARIAKEGAEKIAEAKEKIAEEFLDEKALEIVATQKHYAELLKLAEDAGLSTVQLKLQQQAALKAIDDAYAESDKKKRVEAIQQVVEEINKYYQMFAGLLDQFMDLRNQKEDNALAKMADKRDADLDNLKDQKEKGIITEEQYQSQKQGIENQYRQKEKQVKTEQFIREKRAKVIESIINTFLGVTRALPNPFMMAAAGITGAIQTALIAAQPIPEFAKGALLNGPSHSKGGMPIIDPRTGRPVASVEGGEALLSGATTRNNWDIVSRLLDSSMNGGGRRISLKELIGPQQGYNFSGAQQSIQMAKGAFLTPRKDTFDTPVANSGYSRDNAIFERFVQEMAGMRQDINNWKGSLKTEFVLRDHEKFTDDLETARKLASIRPKNKV